jgi:hypothetical protein
MNNHTNPFPEPSSQDSQLPTRKAEDLSNSTFVAKSLMWISWMISIFGMTVLFLFAYDINRGQDHWAPDSVVIGALSILLPTSLALRLFVIKRINNVWMKFIIYGLGLFVSALIIICGYFAAASGDFILMITGAFMILLHFPACIRIQSSKQ